MRVPWNQVKSLPRGKVGSCGKAGRVVFIIGQVCPIKLFVNGKILRDQTKLHPCEKAGSHRKAGHVFFHDIQPFLENRFLFW